MKKQALSNFVDQLFLAQAAANSTSDPDPANALLHQATQAAVDEAVDTAAFQLVIDTQIKLLTTIRSGAMALEQPIVRLKCCCCGAVTQGRQFHNQDLGYGLGDCCVDYVSKRTEDMERTYGIAGGHFRTGSEV